MSFQFYVYHCKSVYLIKLYPKQNKFLDCRIKNGDDYIVQRLILFARKQMISLECYQLMEFDFITAE